MKNFLCYFGIFLLIVLIAVPPVLRIVLPDKEEEKPEEKIVKQTLSCDSNKYLSRTSYENNVVKMIVIKKVKETTQEETDPSNPNSTETLEKPEENKEENSEENKEENPEENKEGNTNENTEENPEGDKEEGSNPEEESKTELDKMFETLEKDSRVVKNKVEDGEVITVDFSTSEYSGLEVEKLSKPINDQLVYYEDNGLVCSIIE